MKGKTESKKRKKQQNAIRIIVLILLIFLVLLCGFRCSRLEMKNQVVSEYEDDVDKITEIDYSDQQEALNALVEEGKMNVNYSSQAVFKGTVSEKFNIKNISNNHHPITFELYDEENQCIYSSKKINPGYEMNRIELLEELDLGVHNCKLKVGYAEEGNVVSVFPITIEVK